MSANTPGSPMVVIRKARPRTCSRYSRFAMSRILRIGFASHCPDEDFFQRWFDQFEPIDGGARRSFLQQFLRVAMRLQLNLRMPGEVLGFGNLRAVEKLLATLKLNHHVIPFVARFDLAHAAGEHCDSVIDEANRIAELFYLIHAV